MNLDQDYTFGGSADRQPTLNSTFENEFSRAEWERRYSPKRARHHTDFFCDAPEARRVALAGDFNRWDALATPMCRESDGRWTASLELPPGYHRYVFLVDGKPKLDPNASGTVQNERHERFSLMAIS